MKCRPKEQDEPCPLCRTGGKHFYTGPEARPYARCPCCELIWLDPARRLPPDQEATHYRVHRNSPEDTRYRAFLNQLWTPLKKHLTPAQVGLDYGSGPGPTLHHMAIEDGYPCTPFDPLFCPDHEALTKRYDFITCSETAEHFHDPGLQFRKMYDLLRPGGWLGIMTLRPASTEVFANWHYRRDPTHVVFYRCATFEWIADACGFERPLFPNERVALLRRRL